MAIRLAMCWDDGLDTDVGVLKVLEHYGLTASFALNPGRYTRTPRMNDERGTEWGWLVCWQDLPMYAPYEVCNHTCSHPQLHRIANADVQHEVSYGKELLEQTFDRSVPGFVYPYGVFVRMAEYAAKESEHLYGRLGKMNRNLGEFNIAAEPWSTGSWRWQLERCRRSQTDLLLFSHSYELRSCTDWSALADFCKELATDSEIQVVTMTQWVEAQRAHRV